MADGLLGDAMSGAITLEHVSVRYGRRLALTDLSGIFAAGSLTALAGANGAGKSTLLKSLAGLLPHSGHIREPAGQALAYLPQNAEISREVPLSVMQLVATGLWRQSGSFGKITREMKDKVLEALNAVGIKPLAPFPLSEISTGQFQRALFARLSLQEAQTLLLDEPFAAVDSKTAEHLLERIRQWHSEGRTVICALHDAETIRREFPECLWLTEGRCLDWGDTPSVLAAARNAGRAVA